MVPGNPWIGCHAASAECAGCYARELREKRGFDFSTLTLTSTRKDPYTLNALAGRQGCCAFLFASSLTDWFHKDADAWREDAWSVVRDCRNIVWLILTKRIERVQEQLPDDWERNFRHVWLGTTVGHSSSLGRVDALREIPCSRRFLSVEPLLENISDGLDLTGIGWLFVGGMSGKLWVEKPMRLEWAAKLYDLAVTASIPYFFKQVAAYKNEQGSNALGLYLAERSGEVVDPATVSLHRQVPPTDLPLLALNLEKGKRFTAAQWLRYEKRLAEIDPQAKPTARVRKRKRAVAW